MYGTTSHSHDNSPSSAAAVGREHFIIHMITAPYQWLPCVGDIFFLIHMITAPQQRLPCVEVSALSLIQGDRVPSRCMKYTSTEKRANSDAPARKAREGESLDTPMREAREGEESHDTPARKNARRRGVT